MSGNVNAALMPPMSLDMNFIQRNVHDLSMTAQFTHMDEKELQELHKLSYKNLKEQMQPGKPLAVDPQLALETFKTLTSSVIQIVETKRKAAETMLKARTLIDIPDSRQKDGGLIDEEDDLSQEDVSQASLENQGVFGKLTGKSNSQSAADPVL